MKSFLKGLLFAALGGSIGPILSSVASGHLSPAQWGTASVAGAAVAVSAYLHPNPSQQQ